MKALITLTAVFIVAGLAFLYLTAPGLAIGLTIAVIVIVVLYGGVLAGIYAYHRLGLAKLAHSQAFATTIEAAKIPDNIQAVALPHNSKLQITVMPARATILAAPAGPAPALVAPVVTPEGLPEAPSFDRLLQSGFQPTANKMLLGYTHTGPLYGSIDMLLSTGVAGRPGQGKSSLLRFVYAQVALLPGGKVFTLDPHGSITEDVQGGPGLLFDAGSASEFEDAAAWIIAELDRRLKAYRTGQRDFNPIMGLVDELPVVSLASANAKAAIGRIILEGRKVKMYSLISGQGLPADTLGGSLFRDALSSRYIFKTTEAQGRIAGLEKDSRKLLEGLERGRAVFDGPALDRPGIVAVPFVTPDDLSGLFAARPTGYQPTSKATPASQGGYRSQEYSEQGKRQEPLKTAYSASGDNNHFVNVNDMVVTADYRELPAAPGEIEQAARIYRQGFTTARAAAERLGIGKTKAAELLAEARRQGLI